MRIAIDAGSPPRVREEQRSNATPTAHCQEKCKAGVEPNRGRFSVLSFTAALRNVRFRLFRTKRRKKA